MNFLRLCIQRITEPIRIIFRSPLSLFSSPQKLLGMSLPTRVALFLFIALLVASVVTVWLKAIHPDLAKRAHLQYFTGTVLLLITIPLVARKLVQLWLQEVLVRFPDIQASWDVGMRALSEQGMSITSAPLYLVVGPKNAAEARGVMQSSELQFRIEGQADGNPALLWYVCDNAIFVVCPGASQVSLLSNSALSKAGAPETPEPGEDFDQTMDGFAKDWMSATNDFQAGDSGFAARVNDDGVEDWFDVSMSGGEFAGSSSLHLEPSAMKANAQPQINKAALADASEKLSFVCTLLRRHRQPFCATNGIISFLPLRLISTSDNCASALQSAATFDNRVIARTIGLRAHMIVMVGGMEAETGFLELMKRFGPEVSRRNRIGKGMPDLWCVPAQNTLEAVATLASGAFEDNIYPLFRRDHDLKETANTKLYRLLCVTRLRVTERLGMILTNAYSGEKDKPHIPLLGCYFAATGERSDQQAFSASVFRKLLQNPSELDWYPEVRRANDRYLFLRDIAIGLNVVAVALIILLAFN